MSNTTNFILIMIMVQILIASYSITSAIREKPNDNSTSIENTDVNKEPTTLDVLSGKAERIFVNASNTEECKTTYPYGHEHYANNGKCSFIVWNEEFTKGFNQ